MTTRTYRTAQIHRKLGDNLYISGTLTGDNLPALPWTGATAKINIQLRGGNVVVDHGDVTLNVATGAFEYDGGAAIVTQDADYEYEIEVTYSGGAKLTFPNDENAPMTVLRQIA